MKRTFTGKNRIFLGISGIIIAVALVLQICGMGMNLGIDFTGGSLLTYSVGESYDVEDVYAILQAAGYTEYQVTKTEASDASINLRAEMAAEAAEEEAETEETEAEEGILDTDKSGIEQDGLTDLQIRLDLVDDTAGIEDVIAAAVEAQVAGAEQTEYANITNIMVNENDFDSVYAGGFVAEFAVGAEFDAEAVKAAVETALTEDGHSLSAIDVAAFDENGMRVLVAVESQTTMVRDMIETEMAKKYPDFVFVTIDHVSAVAGKDLIANAVKALLIAFACMLVYIAIRFDFYSGVVALGALLHDVLIMCAFMVFFSALFQANSPFIAAVLTIVGYSINNTIIVFDRIRENGKKPGQTTMAKIDIVEMSVSQTLSRTANTTITTLVTLVCLYIFGVDSIREFAFPLIVGMLAGTYSSVCLSGQVWAAWVDKRIAKKAAKSEN